MSKFLYGILLLTVVSPYGMCWPGTDPRFHIHTCARAYANSHTGAHGHAYTGPNRHT